MKSSETAFSGFLRDGAVLWEVDLKGVNGFAGRLPRSKGASGPGRAL